MTSERDQRAEAGEELICNRMEQTFGRTKL